MNPESERDDDRSERTKQSYLRFTIGKSCMYFHWLGVDRNQEPATSNQKHTTNLVVHRQMYHGGGVRIC